MKGDHEWPFSSVDLDGSKIDTLFEFFLGRGPKDETERNVALYIGRHYPNPLLELFRHFICRDEVQGRMQDMYPIIFDLYLRERSFGQRIIPKANLFCIGAARCGTTSLSVLLSEHPAVHLPAVKEPNFFSHHLPDGATESDFSWYEPFFTGYAGERYLCDFSPNYIWSDSAKSAIPRYNPNATIIACIRNPIDRAMSDYFYLRDYHNFRSPVDYFEYGMSRIGQADQAWFSASVALRKGKYLDDIQYWKSHFPRMLIIEFDELSDMARLSTKIFRHLGIKNINPSQRLADPINQSKQEDTEESRRARDLLRDFYRDEIEAIQDVLGCLKKAAHPK